MTKELIISDINVTKISSPHAVIDGEMLLDFNIEFNNKKILFVERLTENNEMDEFRSMILENQFDELLSVMPPHLEYYEFLRYIRDYINESIKENIYKINKDEK